MKFHVSSPFVNVLPSYSLMLPFKYWATTLFISVSFLRLSCPKLSRNLFKLCPLFILILLPMTYKPQQSERGFCSNLVVCIRFPKCKSVFPILEGIREGMPRLSNISTSDLSLKKVTSSQWPPCEKRLSNVFNTKLEGSFKVLGLIRSISSREKHPL